MARNFPVTPRAQLIPLLVEIPCHQRAKRVGGPLDSDTLLDGGVATKPHIGMVFAGYFSRSPDLDGGCLANHKPPGLVANFVLEDPGP